MGEGMEELQASGNRESRVVYGSDWVETTESRTAHHEIGVGLSVTSVGGPFPSTLSSLRTERSSIVGGAFEILEFV